METRFKRFLTLFCTVLILYSVFPCQAHAVSISATAAVLMDVDSGRVLYAQNEDTKMLIASTTKIMTALVALENGDLNSTVKISAEAANTEGSSMYLKAGEKLKLETLLYGLMLCSGNDAAVAVAQGVAGSTDKFVKLMNEKAKALGMTHTSFANPNGLDDDKHYSTAKDMAVLACAAMNNETFSRIVSTRTVTVGGRTLSNHNKLLSYVDGCIGLKTGYTKAAGRTLVSCVRRNGQRLVAVTLQDGNDWADHAALYDYGFSTYPAQRAMTIGETVGTLAVTGGLTTSLPLVAADSFSWPLAQGEKLEVRFELPKSLCAPVTAGNSAGQAVFSLNGKEVGRVELLCGRDILSAIQPPASLLRHLRLLIQGG
ncbi:serine hydrolase [Oscillibacter sp.]|uniref:D-alanyl-D-alanine carboxypeptidase family protein n=1 Tax=Oscillibacter sp. TaxID=1945593 RepID=UPI00339A95A0